MSDPVEQGVVPGSKAYVQAVVQGQREARAELKEAALEVRRATEKLGDRYVKLCELIRERQHPPALVQEVLTAAGFRPERISEIKRVCFCSEELFAQFKGRLVGFKAALQLARGKVDSDGDSELSWTRLLAAAGRAMRAKPKQRYAGRFGDTLVVAVDVMKLPYDNGKPLPMEWVALGGFRVTVVGVDKTKTSTPGRAKKGKRK